MEAREECIVLLDNGSLRPEAVFSLRAIARNLERVLGEKVHPVSLLHSSKIPAEKLNGLQAETWRRFLINQLEEGVSRFRVVPLFFGPSSAIADYLPKVTSEILASLGIADASVQVAKTLLDPASKGEETVARILEELLIQKVNTVGPRDCGVVLVDHGSPLEVVARCRDRVAESLRSRLEGRVAGVIAASMERREGDEYDFNEPLLESALSMALEKSWKRIVLSYLFFSPGRHAGEGGDIDQIVANSEFVSNGGVVLSAPLVGQSPLLIELLAERFANSLD
ncbi:CbiX/SirB N-terminal domain-containing protein [Pelagicoccus sp. SDUM812002]|uniref:sirohydrochlorin chelatase n=1 Tax=Pelagicoccus sp. SDUM812002 TaxID=3041266 RepID=UPI00280D8CAE|nr:CbiX/SirB N-terminal domain-containing protein [Pelagicoccus sp. SDUM812002]MDQ8185294.1 CbiX/SirB N-terminal domain-containing protein [Pelagicoccus sp. SDUM812002]